MTIRSPGGSSPLSGISIATWRFAGWIRTCPSGPRHYAESLGNRDENDEGDMKHRGTLIVMSGEYIGGPQGSWQAMYTHWSQITNQLYRYSDWDHFEKDILYLFDLDTRELISARAALASGPGLIQIRATPKHPV